MLTQQLEEIQQIARDDRAYEAWHQTECDRNNNFLLQGSLDGKNGLDPKHPEEESYWTGWVSGTRSRHLDLQNKKLTNIPF